MNMLEDKMTDNLAAEPEILQDGYNGAVPCDEPQLTPRPTTDDTREKSLSVLEQNDIPTDSPGKVLEDMQLADECNPAITTECEREDEPDNSLGVSDQLEEEEEEGSTVDDGDAVSDSAVNEDQPQARKVPVKPSQKDGVRRRHRRVREADYKAVTSSVINCAWGYTFSDTTGHVERSLLPPELLESREARRSHLNTPQALRLRVAQAARQYALAATGPESVEETSAAPRLTVSLLFQGPPPESGSSQASVKTHASPSCNRDRIPAEDEIRSDEENGEGSDRGVSMGDHGGHGTTLFHEPAADDDIKEGSVPHDDEPACMPSQGLPDGGEAVNDVVGCSSGPEACASDTPSVKPCDPSTMALLCRRNQKQAYDDFARPYRTSLGGAQVSPEATGAPEAPDATGERRDLEMLTPRVYPVASRVLEKESDVWEKVADILGELHDKMVSPEK
ncbi:unnamed protein product [Trypanosoma congolense IL3000]|uniref:WGS project CAEQ00000000 data, annotated contig 78 n=1 Tax=Trypanosoma congolense (strain IL3000) TaxID=1068625 RepID=F9WIG8_TRYCI|nr:unnamed protein product [Trypanosoma congolense IL3000]